MPLAHTQLYRRGKSTGPLVDRLEDILCRVRDSKSDGTPAAARLVLLLLGV
eukprot:COSAG06_NODE_54_length_27948_cov_234.398671_5_plen_51_part_00